MIIIFFFSNQQLSSIVHVIKPRKMSRGVFPLTLAFVDRLTTCQILGVNERSRVERNQWRRVFAILGNFFAEYSRSFNSRHCWGYLLNMSWGDGVETHHVWNSAIDFQWSENLVACIWRYEMMSCLPYLEVTLF